MYNFTKRLTTVTSLLSFINTFISLLFFFYFPNSGLDFSTIIMCTFFLLSSCSTLVVLTIALRGLCDALDLNFVKDADNIREIKQRIHILEESKK